MELIAKNDQRAFEKLCWRHEGRVKRKVKEILRSNSAVEDLTQKIFIQVWKAAPSYVPTAKFTTWLTKIAKNLSLNEKKRATAERNELGLSISPGGAARAREKPPEALPNCAQNTRQSLIVTTLRQMI